MKSLKIRINWTTFIFIFIIFLFKQFKWYLYFLFYICIHECGHIIVAILLKYKIKEINVIPFGINMKILASKTYNKVIYRGTLENIKNIVIEMAGPLVNLIVLLLEMKFNKNIHIIYINLIILFINLLPIHPLDGGRILKDIFCLLLGKVKAVEYINLISNITTVILCVLLGILEIRVKNLSLIFAIVWIIKFRILENREERIRIRVYEILKK